MILVIGGYTCLLRYEALRGGDRISTIPLLVWSRVRRVVTGW